MSDINETARAVAAIVARSQQVRRDIEKTRIALRLWIPSEAELVPIRRAICHPLLGGILRKDAQRDVSGPNFTLNSLRLAISKGHLVCIWKAEKQYVTPAALRDWLGLSEGERRTSRVIQYQPSAAKTNYEKQKGGASLANASAKLLSMKAALAKKKGK
ncbi:hypothetical protein [Rhizobium leguminosarum]|uniref:Uncharacterized protein n=1 Tax=Rhizobium leguminosarum TaxID=384 RepID=A0A7M3DQQ2_RHILE|nr:hypothetical protein [Rhizobium leguminosarum]TAY50974.1 hypothetical protein ELH90_04245 [Rhizobium leguminosarum]